MFFTILAYTVWGSMVADIAIEIIYFQPTTIESLFPCLLKAGVCGLFTYFI